MRDVSNLTLGVNGNMNIARDVAEAVGIEMKKMGIDAIIFGTLDTLSKDDKDPLKRFSTSPYITARIIQIMAEGFSNAGILPMIDGRGNIDEGVVKALTESGDTYPVFVEDTEKVDSLKALGYDGFFYTKDGPVDGKEISLNWKSFRKIDFEKVRRKKKKKAVVILNPFGKGISVNDPKANSKVLIFSADEWLYEIAKKVEKGEIPPTGRKVW